MGNTHVVLSELLNKELYVIVIFLIAILFLEETIMYMLSNVMIG